MRGRPSYADVGANGGRIDRKGWRWIGRYLLTLGGVKCLGMRHARGWDAEAGIYGHLLVRWTRRLVICYSPALKVYRQLSICCQVTVPWWFWRKWAVNLSLAPRHGPAADLITLRSGLAGSAGCETPHIVIASTSAISHL